MHQRQIRIMRRQNSSSLLPSWLVVLLDLGIVFIALRNLEYNRQAAISSTIIARELRRLNRSEFLCRLNKQIDICEREKKETKQIKNEDAKENQNNEKL